MLSRRDENEPGARITAHALSRPEFPLFDAFRQEAATLPEILANQQEIREGTTGEGWTEADGFVLHQGRFFVPASSTFWPQILEHAHSTGHEGVQKTLARVQASFFCPQGVCCASGTKQSTSTPLAFSSHLTFPLQYGATSPWILLKVFRESAASQWYLRWWIVSPRWLISFHWGTPTQL
jgi:hypothetical protein